MNLSDLENAGFDIETRNHALAVLAKDFAKPLSELCETLGRISIEDSELVQGGGGEASLTQRLRRDLSDRHWSKSKVVIRKIVDDVELSATTHEIDHVRRMPNGSIALEIEWNNKDPFFDRDLENFQRLHAEGAISVGVIVTRGQGLQENMQKIIRNWAIRRNIKSFDGLARLGVRPTARQRGMVKKLTEDDKFSDAWAAVFVGDKFGSATTHWNKLQERIRRGVGNPCPLLMVGIPAAVVKRTKP